MKKLLIIGGGAAGLMAAATAKKENPHIDICVIEKNERVARKVMITGKGRCNVTNNCDIEALISNTPKNGKFMYSAFSSFSSADTMRFFEGLGVPLKTERGNRVFPASDKAVDIVDALFKAIKGIRLINGVADKIELEDGRVRGILLKDGSFYEADAVILATGGKSYPITGSTGDGYKIAEALGHTVIPTKPSLVPLECHEGFCSRLSGLSLKNVTLSVFEDDKKRAVFCEMGEMLFTHFGISGPLVLSASAHIRHMAQKKYKAKIDLKPALSEEQLDKRLLRDFSTELNRDFSNSLYELLPKSLIPIVINLSGIPRDIKVNQISREQRKKLIDVIKGFTLHIIDFRPIEEAIITSGGISVKEIDPKTMSSKLIGGLYFAGEIIDVDALTGGFNLQIAFSSGFSAGRAASSKLLEE